MVAVALTTIVLVAVLLRLTLIAPFTVPSSAMSPTLQAGDRILVLRSSFLAGSIGRGDIIVFHRPAYFPCRGSGTGQYLVQRVVALPGETIWSSHQTIYVDGKPMAEPRVVRPRPRRGELGPDHEDDRPQGRLLRPGRQPHQLVRLEVLRRHPRLLDTRQGLRRRRPQRDPVSALLLGMRHPGRAIASAALTIVVAVSAGLLLPDPTSAVPATHTDSIRLLPVPSAGGRVWNWSAACPLGPRTGAHCQGAGPVLGRAQLNGDEWNLGVTKPAEGVVRMTMTPTGGLTVRGQLPVAPPCTAATCLAPSANTWVRAYTNVSYGKNPCRAATSPAGDPALRLPVKVSALPTDLVGTTSYVVAGVADHLRHRVRHVAQPFGHPAALPHPRDRRGDGVDRLRPPGAPSLAPGRDHEHPLRRGRRRPSTGPTPGRPMSSTSTGPGGPHRTVPPSSSCSTPGDVVPAGTVSVDVTKALSEVGTLLERDYGWSDFASHYWLDTIPFGMEVGPVNAQPWGTGSTNFTLGLSSYCFGLNATVAHPKC